MKNIRPLLCLSYAIDIIIGSVLLYQAFYAELPLKFLDAIIGTYLVTAGVSGFSILSSKEETNE